jgi:hypothetical protein
MINEAANCRGLQREKLFDGCSGNEFAKRGQGRFSPLHAAMLVEAAYRYARHEPGVAPAMPTTCAATWLPCSSHRYLTPIGPSSPPCSGTSPESAWTTLEDLGLARWYNFCRYSLGSREFSPWRLK